MFSYKLIDFVPDRLVKFNPKFDKPMWFNMSLTPCEILSMIVIMQPGLHSFHEDTLLWS